MTAVPIRILSRYLSGGGRQHQGIGQSPVFGDPVLAKKDLVKSDFVRDAELLQVVSIDLR